MIPKHELQLSKECQKDISDMQLLWNKLKVSSFEIFKELRPVYHLFEYDRCYVFILADQSFPVSEQIHLFNNFTYIQWMIKQ